MTVYCTACGQPMTVPPHMACPDACPYCGGRSWISTPPASAASGGLLLPGVGNPPGAVWSSSFGAGFSSLPAVDLSYAPPAPKRRRRRQWGSLRRNHLHVIQGGKQ